MESVNIIIAGVGGQGVLLATKIVCNARKDSISSEIHGMAQRGGAVVSHVRIGQEVYSPTISIGCADVILGLEPVEVLRVLRFVHSSTLIIMNVNPVIPPSVSSGAAKYPSLSLLLDKCHHFTQHTYCLNARKLAEEAGSIRTQNVVMIGALAATKILPIDNKSIEKSIHELVPSKYLTANLKAFAAGLHSLSFGSH